MKSENSHRLKALLEARDQLVRAQARARQPGTRAATIVRHQVAVAPGDEEVRCGGTSGSCNTTRCCSSVTALMEALGAIESQIAWLDEEQLKGLARRLPVYWRLMSVSGVGPIVALALVAPIEDVGRFRRMRDVGVYLGLTPKRYQSGETDVGLGISHQGDAMARHYLYEAANVLLTTVKKPSALKSWGLKLLKRRGPSARGWRWRASSLNC
jgi:transposase